MINKCYKTLEIEKAAKVYSTTFKPILKKQYLPNIFAIKTTLTLQRELFPYVKLNFAEMMYGGDFELTEEEKDVQMGMLKLTEWIQGIVNKHTGKTDDETVDNTKKDYKTTAKK